MSGAADESDRKEALQVADRVRQAGYDGLADWLEERAEVGEGTDA